MLISPYPQFAPSDGQVDATMSPEPVCCFGEVGRVALKAPLESTHLYSASVHVSVSLSLTHTMISPALASTPANKVPSESASVRAVDNRQEESLNAASVLGTLFTKNVRTW